MSVIIQDNFSTAAAKPTDARYGPYNNVAAAQSAIPQTYRYKGLTVGVLNSGVVEEYWWANGVTDPDLVQKTATGNVTGITQGTGIIVDNTNPQIPDISVDTSYVQVVSNLSTSVPTDGTSDVKYPSVKAVKDYADGLVVGLLNDRGNWAAGASPGAYPTNPPATGSGPAGAILKGDIWFISTNGFLGTTAVSIGASVRALVDSPSPSTDADWDIIDAGLGFTPENVTNKVSTGANVNADPTSTSKYPSVRALVEYVQTYAPAPTTPNLQAVTNAGASTTNSISAQAFGFYDSSTLSYAALSCDTTGSPSRILIEDSYASPRLSLDTAGTDLTVWANTGSTQAILDFASVSGTKTYTFPNATGTIALTSDLSSYVPYTNATSDIDIGDHNIIAQKSLLGGTISAGFGIFSSYPVVYVNDTSTSSLSALIINNNVGALCLRNSFNIAYLQCTNISSPDKILELPDVTGTLVATIATSAGDLSTGTDGKVTIPDATTSARGLLNSTDWNTFNNKVDGSGTTNYLARWSSGSTIGSSSVIFDDGTRVGIKTATPNTSYDLTINGTTLCTNDVTIDAAKSLYFYKLKFTGNTANNLDYLQMVSQTSNYGASIYLEANGTPSVYGYVWQSRSNTAENGFIIVGCNANPSGAVKDRNAHIISTYANSGTAQGWPLKFRVAKAGQSWNGNTGAEDLIVLTPDQNVGIGTASPTANFQVAQPTSANVGTVSISAGSSSVTGVGTQFTNTFKVGDSITIGIETRTITVISSDTILTVNSSWSQIITNGPYNLTGGTRFVVRGNGNVGIGTTSPAYTLDVSGSGNYYLSGNTPSAPYNNKFSIRNGMLRIGIDPDATNASRFIQFTNEGDTAGSETFFIGTKKTDSPDNGEVVLGMGSKTAMHINSGASTTSPIKLGNTVITFKEDGRIRYVPLTTAPTTNLQEGDTYFDSTLQKLRVYTSTGWQNLN